MKILYVLLMGLILLLVILAGCQVARGFWQGLTNPELPIPHTEVLSKIDKAIDQAKSSGTIEPAKLVELLELIKSLVQTTQDEKMPFWQFIGYSIGISMASYLATRKLRIGVTELFKENHTV
jgi:hypothetical protein